MAANSSVDVLSNCNSSGDQFYECMDSYPGNLLVALVIMLNVIFFLPLNCWILWLLRRQKGVAKTDCVILNQSVVEIICDISLIVFLTGTLPNKKVVTLIANYLCSTFLVGRPLFQTFFCVERYLAVVHPLIYLKYSKAPRVKALIVGLVWLIILMFGWYTVYSYPKLPIWLFVGTYLVVLVVCSSCSFMILCVLKRPKPGDGKDKQGAYQQKKRAFITITVILITLVFGYGTISCAFMLRDKIPYHTFCLTTGLSWWTLVPSSAIQPYLYLSKVNRLPCIKIA